MLPKNDVICIDKWQHGSVVTFSSRNIIIYIHPTGLILCLHPANERWRYTVSSSLIDWGAAAGAIMPLKLISQPSGQGTKSLPGVGRQHGNKTSPVWRKSGVQDLMAIGLPAILIQPNVFRIFCFMAPRMAHPVAEIVMYWCIGNIRGWLWIIWMRAMLAMWLIDGQQKHGIGTRVDAPKVMSS